MSKRNANEIEVVQDKPQVARNLEKEIKARRDSRRPNAALLAKCIARKECSDEIARLKLNAKKLKIHHAKLQIDCKFYNDVCNSAADEVEKAFQSNSNDAEMGVLVEDYKEANKMATKFEAESHVLNSTLLPSIERIEAMIEMEKQKYEEIVAEKDAEIAAAQVD